MSAQPAPGPLPPPDVPALRATPERLIQLLVTIANRLERLEGIVGRMDDQINRLERRFDGAECRLVALNDSICLTNLLINAVPALRQIVLAMLAVFAVSVLMVALGILLAVKWPRLLQMLF